MLVVEPEADETHAVLHVRQPVGRDVDASGQSTWREREGGESWVSSTYESKSVRVDTTHPLNQEDKLLPSGDRLAVPPASKNPFVPLSIIALNAMERRS